MKCPNCYSENPSDTQYCGKCGTKFSSAEQVSARQTETFQASLRGLSVGSTFAGRYQVLEELGKGGMGSVYKVLDNELRESTALKLLKPEIAADEKIIERFRNELKLARKISHKNVCRMYHLSKKENTYYITMEYIPGEDLKSLIRKIGQMPIAKAVSIAQQVCEGLDQAHKLGIVHRDLKPQNIMIDKEGNARIMDFGIARSLKAKGITEAEVLIGTPEYMSPEQVEGKETDQRSDIYSLGTILYEMVTGRAPFEGDTTLSIAMKHKKETPVNPREFNALVPEDLSQLILRCMEKDKERRFQDAKELFSELGKIGEEKPESRKISETKWKSSIAVLPFADLSPQKDQEYFCDGLSEELINALTKIKDLRVVARTSAFSFKGEKMDVREIGKKLDVETVLEGSVRKAGNRVRITSQLINVVDGYHLWSEKYDRDMEDIFAIQDDVTLAIVDTLKVKLLGGEKVELTKRYTENLEAYNLNLKGRHFLKHYTKEGLQKSLESFQQAIEKDPKYAMAYAGISAYFNNLGYYNFVSPKNAFPKAREAIEKALEIDDNLGEAHTSLGFYKMFYEWDWEGAEKELKRGIELNPNNASSLNMYAHYLWIMGRFDEALKENKHAQELNPLSRMVAQTRATIYWTGRQYDRGIEEYKKLLEISPDYYTARFWLAFPYAFKGMHDEAIAAVEKAMTVSGGAVPLMWVAIGFIYAIAGKKDEAEKVLNKMLEQSKKSYVAPWMIAAVYGGLDKKNKAFEWLEKSFKERDHWLTYIKTSPVVDNLRSDPRFPKMLKRMGFNK
ncbi:MAG: protein kinase [Candidatus Aminicenantes bacterium]|nr:MAG: protein kinase [Candidatus Aminicenantes bacterium]